MNRVVTSIVVAFIASVVASPALAQSDQITQRKELMKSNGAATRTGTQMARGEAAFDAAKAREVFQNYEQVGTDFPNHFPENTKSGDTRAAPKIWEDMAGFRALSQKLSADARAAMPETASLDTFRPAFQRVTETCGTCHRTYRLEQPAR